MALIAGVPFILAVNANLPVQSVADLVKLAKERKLTYGSGGVGAFHHLNSELFSSMTGIKMTHVPYKGSVPAMTDLVSGQIHVLFTDIGPSIQLIRAGKARALGITSARARGGCAGDCAARRSSACRDSTRPPGRCWSRRAARRSSILAKLNAEVNAIVQTDEVTKQFIGLGLMPIGKGSLEELEAYTRSEVTRWSKVINDAGIAGTQ